MADVGYIIYRSVDPGWPFAQYGEYDRWPVKVEMLVCFKDHSWREMSVEIKVTNPFRVTDEEIIAKAGAVVRIAVDDVVYIGLKSWQELEQPDNTLED